MNTDPKRFHYLDWLRVLAVLALFPFHAGQIFNEAAFYVKDQITSPMIMGISDFIYQWHMPLFMFLAGIGSHYALRFRSGKEYLIERFKRLIVPLIFGTLVIVPPMTYFRMFGDPNRVWPEGSSQNAIDGFDKLYFEYYPDFFHGIFPNGNFEWGHLWFLAYLFTFSLIALPLFLFLLSEKGKPIIAYIGESARKPLVIFLYFIPLSVFEVCLRWAYPNMQNLVSDWANFLLFISVFIYGFIVASEPHLEAAIDKYWKSSLFIGLLIASALSVVYAGKLQAGLNETTTYVVEKILRGICIWFSLIGILGFGRRYLNQEGAIIRYASKVALPLYIIHLPIVVILGFYIIRFELPIAVKYSAIAVLSLISSLLFYEIAIRRYAIIRFLLGMKSRQ